MDIVMILKAAEQQAMRREAFCKNHSRPCPECGTTQIQIITKPDSDFEWRCRRCKTRFI